MRPSLSKLAIVSLLLAAPLAAQTAGMQVVDPKGGVVGTVTGVMGDHVVVKTDRHEVRLPKASFTVDQSKLLFGMTQAELNAATDASLAAASAALVAGAAVKGPAGESVGTIDRSTPNLRRSSSPRASWCACPAPDWARAPRVP